MARAHSVFMLVFAVAACGGDDDGVSVVGTAPLVVIPTSTPTPTPTPTPVPVPPPPSSDDIYIDAAKIPAAAVGFASFQIVAEPNEQPSENPNATTGQFRITCDYSHMNFDDPIVYPGKPGAAHLHVYFGNTGINSASTQQSIENTGNSTCAGGTANRTGYWAPAIIDTKDGTPIKPSDILLYYKSDPFPGNRVKPYPPGLRMIAGNPKPTGPDPDFRSYWVCAGPDGSQGFSSIPPNCPVGGTVEATVNFPSCWDGINLDSPDHKSHMAYGVPDTTSPTNFGCPKSHPVQLPTLNQMVRYKVIEAGSTARWRLSSDHYSHALPGGYNLHADWFNGWDPKVQEIWVKNCLQANRDCHGYLLGDGTKLFL